MISVVIKGHLTSLEVKIQRPFQAGIRVENLLYFATETQICGICYSHYGQREKLFQAKFLRYMGICFYSHWSV